MTIRVIIADLDGVLIDSRELHFKVLNMALAEIDASFVISREEHLAKYDGHPTKYKLNLLSKEKGLPPMFFDKVWRRKQELTQDYILQSFNVDERLVSIFRALKGQGYTLYCASNSIWITVKNSLLKIGVLPYIDYFISNEEVKMPKPSPDVYFRCFERSGVSPKEVMICEDSPVGRQAAYTSGANVCPIDNVADFTLDKITSYINKFNKINKYNNMNAEVCDKVINIVIPMAGQGSRFAKANYSHPKPLIDVNGKPMIQKVVENVGIKGRFIFIVQKEHYDKYNLKYVLNLIAPSCEIVVTEGVTKGAACSILLAKDFINNKEPLMLANSDQLLEWDPYHFLHVAMSDDVDGCISTFTNTHPKFSYVRLNDDGYVVEVAEKKPISNVATTGVYFWKQGKDFVNFAEQMIRKQITVNGEYYTAPVFNEAIEQGKKIKTVHCDKFHCIGTPEDLEHYLRFNNV